MLGTQVQTLLQFNSKQWAQVLTAFLIFAHYSSSHFCLSDPSESLGPNRVHPLNDFVLVVYNCGGHYYRLSVLHRKLYISH